jgi:hypothetical protein
MIGYIASDILDYREYQTMVLVKEDEKEGLVPYCPFLGL